MRFSLRSMLIVTAVLAVYCAVFFALPPGLSVLVLWTATAFLCPTAAIAGIIYGKSYVRAFCIGIISSGLWLGITLVFFTEIEMMLTDLYDLMEMSEEDAQLSQLICVFLHALTILCGFTTVSVRWLCLRSAAETVALSTAAIEPQGKAELYTILQGRMAGAATEEISAGIGRNQFLQEKTEIAETNAEAINR